MKFTSNSSKERSRIDYLENELHKLRIESASLRNNIRNDEEAFKNCVGGLKETQEAIVSTFVDMSSRIESLESAVNMITPQAVTLINQEVGKNSKVIQYTQTKMQEILNYSEALGKRTNRLKAVFLVQMAETWPSIASIWKAFENDPLWEATLVVLPFYHPFSAGETISSYLIEAGIDFEKHTIYDIDRHRPDIVFYQEPYDSTQPENYQIRTLVNKGFRVGYAPYGVELGGTEEGIRFQFNLDMQNLAWRVFARSERHKKMYGKYCDQGNKHVVVTGHPKFDLMSNYEPDDYCMTLKNKINGRKAVMWNPHFCMDPAEQYSTFLTYHKVIVDYFKEHPEMFLILRPHPLFYQSVTEKGYMSEEDYHNFFKEISLMENVVLDKEPNYQTAFYLSDALISDIGSFILEYLATNKPLLLAKTVLSPAMNDDGSIEKYHYVGDEPHKFVDFLDMISRSEDPMKNERLSIIPEYLFGLDGHVGERIKAHVTEHVLSEIYSVENQLVSDLKSFLNELNAIASIHEDRSQNAK